MFNGVQCMGFEVVELHRNPNLAPDAFYNVLSIERVCCWASRWSIASLGRRELR